MMPFRATGTYLEDVVRIENTPLEPSFDTRNLLKIFIMFLVCSNHGTMERATVHDYQLSLIQRWYDG
jgi:hypothetical protein